MWGLHARYCGLSRHKKRPGAAYVKSFFARAGEQTSTMNHVPAEGAESPKTSPPVRAGRELRAHAARRRRRDAAGANAGSEPHPANPRALATRTRLVSHEETDAPRHAAAA